MMLEKMNNPHRTNEPTLEVERQWHEIAGTAHVCPLMAGKTALTFDECQISRREIHVEHSALFDITEQAQSLYGAREQKYPYPDRSRVYAVGSPHLPGLEYVWGPQETSAAERHQQLTERPLSPGKARTANKAETRKIAEEIDLLAQPVWKDLDLLLSGLAHSITFHKIDWSTLPYQKLLGEAPEIECLIVQGLEKGFALRAEEGQIRVVSQSPHVISILRDTNVLLNEAQLLEFLQKLNERDFKMHHVSFGNQEIRFRTLLEILSETPDGTWFLKSVDGVCGYHVAKLVLQGGVVKDVQVAGLQAELFLDERGEPLADQSPEAILRHMVLLRSSGIIAIDAAILEKGIPTEVIDGILAEQRIVFGFNYSPFYLCSYSKVASVENVVPNRSQGGDAEPVRTSFARIFEAHGFTGERLNEACEHCVEKMKEEVSSFAIAFMAKAFERVYNYGPVCAVDVCPVWNYDTNDIDFVLLEVQAGPGTEGASGNIPPEEVEAIRVYDESLSSYYDDQSMY